MDSTAFVTLYKVPEASIAVREIILLIDCALAWNLELPVSANADVTLQKKNAKRVS